MIPKNEPFSKRPPFLDSEEINQILKFSSSSTYPRAFNPLIIISKANIKKGVAIKKDKTYLINQLEDGKMISQMSVT